MDDKKLIQMCEDIASIKSDMQHFFDHIKEGSKWRVAITISCIGLIGTIVTGIVRFSVMEYKVCSMTTVQTEMRTQIYDLNYVRGKAEGLAEKEGKVSVK